MEYREMLHRYVGRRVCISTFGHAKLWGRLAAVTDDSLRLNNTTMASDGDDQWLAQSQFGDENSSYGARCAETVIHFHHIVAITCLDDDLPEIFSDAPSERGFSREGAISGRANVYRPAADPLDRLFNDEVFDRIHVERLEILIGSGLVPLADPTRENGLADRVIHLRNLVGSQLGFVLPPVRLRDDNRLSAEEYRICINGTEVARGTVRATKLLAINGGGAKAIFEGERTFEPLFAQPAVWIDSSDQEAAEEAGYLLAEPAAVLAMHLQDAVKQQAHELFSLESLRLSLEHLRHTSPTVVDELVPHRLSLARLHDLLARLLEEGVSLRPLERILERVAHLPAGLDDTEEMLVALRLSLGRILCQRWRDANGHLSLVTLDRDISARLHESFSGGGEKSNGIWLAGVIDGVRCWYLEQCRNGKECPLVVDTPLRRRLRQLLAHQVPGLAVLAFAEIPQELPVQLVASLGPEELGIEVPRRSRKKGTGKSVVPASQFPEAAPKPPTKRRAPR